MIRVRLCHLSPRTRRLALIWTKWAPCLAAVNFIAVSVAEAWSRLDLIPTPHPSPSCESRLAKLKQARRWASHTLPHLAPLRPSTQPTYTWPNYQTAIGSLFVSLSLCEFFFYFADTFHRTINWIFLLPLLLPQSTLFRFQGVVMIYVQRPFKDTHSRITHARRSCSPEGCPAWLAETLSVFFSLSPPTGTHWHMSSVAWW